MVKVTDQGLSNTITLSSNDFIGILSNLITLNNKENSKNNTLFFISLILLLISLGSFFYLKILRVLFLLYLS
jgi:hypothetical protein